MKFTGLMPFSSGVVQSPNLRSKQLAFVLASISYHNLEAVLISIRHTKLGYEWQAHSIESLETLFSLEARENHIRFRRTEKFHFSVSVVEPVGMSQVLLPFENFYILFLI